MARTRIAGLVVLALALLVAAIVVVLRRDVPPSATDPTSPPSASAPSSPAGLPAAPPSSGTVPGPCPRTGTSAPLTVLSFNIHGADGREGYDLEQVAAEIRRWDADVVLLQEVHRFRLASGLEDQPARLSEMTGMTAVFGQAFSEPPEAPGAPRRRSGTAMLTTLPVVAHHLARLPHLPGTQPRSLLRVTVALDGRPVDVYGTHLDPAAGSIRLLQVHAIARAVRRRANATARPFVLGGDFNTVPESRAMAVVGGFTTDPWPLVGVGVGETVLPREPRRRIDYVLHGPGWRDVTAMTLLSQVADHRALRTSLSLLPPC